MEISFEIWLEQFIEECGRNFPPPSEKGTGLYVKLKSGDFYYVDSEGFSNWKNKKREEFFDNKKYYFITYQATGRWCGSISVFNKVIANSPMRFVSELNSVENDNYKNYIVLNTCEISEKDYKEYERIF